MSTAVSSFKHNMQPPAGILNVFSRLNYKTHYAVAEFVDNSTQSYLLHRDELRKSAPDFQLSIIVTYDARGKTLVVEDNAYGMELDRFLDAITLDAKNSDQVNSRNEFGMGLKTAASWFGNVWSVSSTAYGSDKRYVAVVDIPKLQETGENDIDIRVESADPNDHGTTIKIWQTTKGMGPRSVGKTRSMLASMYRRDLASGEIRINVNDQDISFEGYNVLSFRNREWKREVDFTFSFGEKEYHVTGFVAIMSPGAYRHAGFALFRRNRVVIGGEGHNYKPSEIFGNTENTQVSLKLFGELDVDHFPVNQAKDGFIWDDGLEDEFIIALKDNIQEYIDVAKLSVQERAREEQYSSDASERVESEVSRAIANLNSNGANDAHAVEEPPEDNKPTNTSGMDEPITDLFVTDLAIDNASKTDFLSVVRQYDVKLDSATTQRIYVAWEISGNSKWITVTTDDEEAMHVTINVNHRFFKPYSNEEEFQVVLEKLVIAFVVSEARAKLNSDKDGFIFYNSIRNNMNDLLGKLSSGM